MDNVIQMLVSRIQQIFGPGNAAENYGGQPVSGGSLTGGVAVNNAGQGVLPDGTISPTAPNIQQPPPVAPASGDFSTAPAATPTANTGNFGDWSSAADAPAAAKTPDLGSSIGDLGKALGGSQQTYVPPVPPMPNYGSNSGPRSGGLGGLLGGGGQMQNLALPNNIMGAPLTPPGTQLNPLLALLRNRLGIM